MQVGRPTMCPPGTDQTTRGMQRWTLMVPTLEEQYDLTEVIDCRNSYTMSLQFLKEDFTFDAFDRLARHESGTKRDPTESYRNLHTRRSSASSSAIERLPPELMSMVLSDPDLSSNDIVSLGLASNALWVLFLAHAQQIRRMQSWAGKPLLCTGTYLMSVPPAIHTMFPNFKTEEEEFFNRPGRGLRGAPCRGMCPARKWNWNARNKFVERSKLSLKDELVSAFIAVSPKSNIRAVDLATLRHTIEWTLSAHDVPKPLSKQQQRAQKARAARCRPTPTPTHWVLRNMTTREYAVLKQAHIYRSERNYFHISGLPFLSVDKALLMRVTWADDSDEDDYTGRDESVAEKSLKQGSWAGHCFEIVNMRVDASHEGWSNVTKELREEAKMKKRFS
ncbi:uncharacterized protein LTR77_004131 [Saxophila tyrrhenica]|uniref:F-box domain-containing protein n=1 Tax=Saxophila tyrrhenica TaxID=1690608 RepID=A0AAV9PBX7_9PEZI|nr:hypothetical protein LTR77_004131 [Saxophila tyrrhenica]